MNEILKTILNRRSIRKFKPEQLKIEELQVILKAGKYAPTAMNQQPWHFTVIQSQEVLNKINEACKKVLIKTKNKRFEQLSKGTDGKDISVMHNTPVLIVVSGNQEAIAPQIDCALAIQNMFIAAESLGIGSCWIYAIYHLYSDADGKDFLIKEGIIPKDYVLAGSCAFGYKAIEPQAPPRKDDVVTFI